MTALGHGLYDDGRPYRGDPVCPLCDRVDDVIGAGVARTWYCAACDLAFDGTSTERHAMAERRQAHLASLIAGTPPPEPIAPLEVPHDHHPCQVCGERHASRPDPRAPRPRTSTPAAPDRAAYRRRWTSPSSGGHDPDGRPLAWPTSTGDPDGQPPADGHDPAAAEAALLADMAAHDRQETRA